MTNSTDAELATRINRLDEAFDRMAASSAFELPNGFVNHGPMAVEALSVLRCDEEIDEWARRFAKVPGPAVQSVPTAELDWRNALGEYRLLPEWMGHMQVAIDEEGWPKVVEVWVPRLMPALSTKLFHGAIRAAHAIRALEAIDTPSRRAELARALGYWAARYAPGQVVEERAPEEDGGGADLRDAVTRVAAEGARRYLTAPDIFNLHGVTGAMAVELFVDHLSTEAAAAGLAQVRAEHAALYAATDPSPEVRVAGLSDLELAKAAAASGDVHQVKLVEACRRGLEISGDPVFAAAAETVTGQAGR